MRKMEFLLFIFLFFNSIITYKLEEDKNYFQLYPSEDKEKCYLFHFYNLDSQFITVNTTEGENMTIIQKSKKENETPIKNLSSIIQYDSFIIKTCFGPDKILEIIDENNEIITPKDDYFKNVKENLENIKYCYSAAIVNPYLVTEHSIVTYWTEIKKENEEEIYEHKSIIFFPNKKTFSKIYDLDSKGNNIFAHSCTNIRYKYIYCNIDPSISLSKINDFSIIPSYLNVNDIVIYFRLVTVIAKFSNSIYHKSIGLHKYIYSKTGKYADYFLTQYHDKIKNKTRLMTSIYINYDLYSFILRFEDIEVYHGINIEDVYIDPNLFNHLLPNNNELIIIYIMKGYTGNNLLLLSKYDYNTDLKYKSNLTEYSLNNYLREDICKKPKYMQSMFANSFINYNTRDKAIIQNNKDKQFYIYQRDIATIISCDDENGNVFYEAKKIQMPQCLNTLNEINGMSNAFNFVENDYKIILDFENDPNYKSFRNVEIEFFDSYLYNRFIIIQGVKNGERSLPVNKSMIFKNIDRLEFSRTFNFRKGKSYQILYRIRQTESSKLSTKCHLTSDVCYFEFTYKKPNEPGKTEETSITEEPDLPFTCPYCEEWENQKTCVKCENIIGIKNKTNECGCQCDVENGFEKEPNNTIQMCICKEDFSFYKNIELCLPNTELNNGKYCIIGQDESSLINIYDNISHGISVVYENGLPYCRRKINPFFPQPWFNLGQNIIFNYIKIDDCVLILYDNTIVMYSDRIECQNKSDYDYSDYLKEPIKNDSDFYSLLDNAYEYKQNDDNYSFIKENNNDTFYLLNNYTDEKYSSVKLSEQCLDKAKKELNLDSLLTMVAAIKKEGKRSTQVEYLFYNPIPKLINERIDVYSYCQKKENETDTSTAQTRALSISKVWTNNNDYPLNINEILSIVHVDWKSEELKKIRELTNKSINIFDLSDPFYQDVCFNYTTPKNTDIYLRNRKNYYFIREPFCETGCDQVGFDIVSERVICSCKIKNGTYDYDKVTFTLEIDKKFNKSYSMPNIKVLQCLFKKKNVGPGFWISLFLLLAFIVILLPNRCCKCKLADPDDRKEKNKKEIYDWEEPFEQLKKDRLKQYEDKPDPDSKNENDPDIYNDLRIPLDQIPKKNLIDEPQKKKHHDIKNKSGKQISIKIEAKNLITNEDENSIDTNNINNERDDETIVIENNNNINNDQEILNINSIQKKKEEELKRKKEEEIKKKKEEELKRKKEKEEEERKKRDNALIDNDDNNSNYTDSSKSTNPKKKQLSYSKDSISFDEKEKSHVEGSNHNANPPIRVNDYMRQPSREHMNQDNNNENRGENQGKEPCYQRYIFSINKAVSKYQSGKSKNGLKYNFFEIFAAKIISDSNILFVMPFICQIDMNGYFIKFSFLFIYIGFVMIGTLLTEINLSDLQLFGGNKEYNCKDKPNYFWKILFGFFIYFFEQYLRKAISLREFYLDEDQKIDKIENKYKDKPDKVYFLKEEIHGVKTRIKKFRNIINNNLKIISFLGFFILLINFIYSFTFCRIFKNSFIQLTVHVILYMVLNFIISLIINFLEAISKFDIKHYLFILYMPCCLSCYWIFKLLLKEEYKEIEDDNNIDENNSQNPVVRNQINNQGE